MTVKDYIKTSCKTGDVVLLMHNGWQIGHLIVGLDIHGFMYNSVYPLRVVSSETVEMPRTTNPDITDTVFILEVSKGEKK